MAWNRYVEHLTQQKPERKSLPDFRGLQMTNGKKSPLTTSVALEHKEEMSTDGIVGSSTLFYDDTDHGFGFPALPPGNYRDIAQTQ